MKLILHPLFSRIYLFLTLLSLTTIVEHQQANDDRSCSNESEDCTDSHEYFQTQRHTETKWEGTRVDCVLAC